MSEHSLTYDGAVTRAKPLTPDDRRAAIRDAVLPLLLENGPNISTRQIATACGVAEGTIFRVFETKQDVIDHVVRHALSPEMIVETLHEVPADGPLDDLVAGMVEAIQRHSAMIHQLMPLLAHPSCDGPDKGHHGKHPVARATTEAIQIILEPRAAELATTPRLAATAILALSVGSTFASDQRPDSRSIARTLLHGIATSTTDKEAH